jgi:hypothetical protein
VEENNGANIAMNNEIDKCKGISGRLFGHVFEPRYNTQEGEGKMPNVDMWSPSFSFGTDVPKVIESTKSRKRIYVHDICIRCGKVIKKESVGNGNESSSAC